MAFKFFYSVLKGLVAKCVEEVRRKQDKLADSLLMSCYRYLCGYGNGMLSDPLLHRVVYSLMIKLFWKLVASLRSLGVKLVFANFHRMIIATNHNNIDSAKEYVDFILQAIRAKDSFSFLDVSNFFRNHLYLDNDFFSFFFLYYFIFCFIDVYRFQLKNIGNN